MENEIKSTDGNSENSKKKGSKQKSSILMRIINIVTTIIIILAVVFTIQAIYSQRNIHNNYFGYAVLPVKSDSMRLENGGKDNFKRGDMIIVKILKGNEKKELEVGDVITFKWFDMNGSTEQLNTHRIIQKNSTGYITQGDAEVDGIKSMEKVDFEDVVGIYKTKMVGVGNAGLFLESKSGMFVVIVVPFFLLLAVSVVYFIKNFKKYSKERTEEVAESTINQERERLRLEILAEMEREKNSNEGKNTDKTD